MSTITITVNGNNNTGNLFGQLNHSVNNFTHNTTTQFNTMNQTIINNTNNAGNSIIRMFMKLPPQVQAAVVAAAAAIATTFAAAIGASLSAMLLTVIGGGVIAAGIVKAAKDPAVSGAFKSLGQRISSDVGKWAQSFVEPLVKSAAIFKEAWEGAVGHGIERAFHVLAPVVERLAQGFSGLANNAMPGFNKAIDTAKPVLEKFAQLLPEIGDALGDFFESISKNEDGALKGMVFIVALLTGAIRGLGNTIEFLSGLFDTLTDASEDVNRALSKIPLLGRIFDPIADSLERFNNTAEGGVGYAKVMEEYLDKDAMAANKAAEASKALVEQMDDLFDSMTTTTDSAIKYEQAIDDLTESFKENGRNIDITSQKGRDNVKAVEEVARAAWAARDAAIGMAGGENASAQAVDNANAKFRQQIDALAAQLRQLGLNEAQVQALLQQWYNLANAPNVSKTYTVRTIYIGGRPVSPSEQSGDYRGGGGRASGGIVGAASGGARSRLTMVGEYGPELVDFAQGRVFNNGHSRRMMQQMGENNGNTVVMQGFIGAGAGSFIAEILNRMLNHGQLQWKVDASNRVKVA